MIEVRRATPQDAAAIANIHVASWRESYAGVLPKTLLESLSVGERTAMWTSILNQPPSRESTVVFLAQHPEEAVGFGSCGGQRSEDLREQGYDCEISAIYVLRAYQRRGLGAQLLSAMMSNLSDRGFRSAALWVLKDNVTARRFYDQRGGRVIAEREEVEQGTVLTEVAYGWATLHASGSTE